MLWDLEDRTIAYMIDPRNDRLVCSRQLKAERVAAIQADIRDDDTHERNRETILAHKKWRDTLMLTRKLGWKNGEFRGHIPQLIAVHLRKHGIGSESLVSERKILLRKNGEVIEILPNGQLGDVLVPAREL